MDKNQKHLVYRHIHTKPRHREAKNPRFCHYMAQIGVCFLLESANAS